jgi:hypothetical protein
MVVAMATWVICPSPSMPAALGVALVPLLAAVAALCITRRLAPRSERWIRINTEANTLSLPDMADAKSYIREGCFLPDEPDLTIPLARITNITGRTLGSGRSTRSFLVFELHPHPPIEYAVPFASDRLPGLITYLKSFRRSA